VTPGGDFAEVFGLDESTGICFEKERLFEGVFSEDLPPFKGQGIAGTFRSHSPSFHFLNQGGKDIDVIIRPRPDL
jgi:hypothetical protein